MSCKEAIEILRLIVEYALILPPHAEDAVKMAITALEIQDGNLYLRDVPGSVSIGIVKGNVYMEGYGDG